MAQNLRDEFKDISLKYSGRVAMQYRKDGEWADVFYNDFRRDVELLSRLLLKEGIKKYDRCAILLDNRSEWPLVFFASISIGAISVPLNPESGEKEIEGILRNSQAQIMFTGNEAFIDKVSSSKYPSLKKIISVDSDEFKNALNSSERISDAEIEISPSDLACILYTSGTTDKPKGVMLSHKNLLSNSDSLRQLNLFSCEDSVLSILPLHHAYPLTITMLLPLLYGGKIIYPGTIRPEALFKTMEELNPTFFVAVPQIFYLFYQNIRERLRHLPWPFSVLFRAAIDYLHKVRNKTGINLTRPLLWGLHRKFGRSLRLFVSGGAKLDEDAQEALYKFGFTILEGYGLTETSPVLTMNPLKGAKIGSAGLPIPGVELKIVDKDESGVGEVIVRGPNVMEGYYRREDLTASVIKDGWFHTGDLGYIDEDGYLFLTGRLKEVVVLSSGLNIYPEEIEEAYAKHVPTEEMCVFEVPAKKGLKESMVLWAIVVPDREFFRRFGEINLRDVIKERIDNVSRTLPPHKRIMGFSITFEKLPRTLLGKIKRFAVKEMYTPEVTAEGRAAHAPKELSKEDLELIEGDAAKKVIGYLKSQTKVENIAPGDLLELDLGIDSLGRVELASGLEKLLNIGVKDENISGAFTVRDLIVGIKALLPEGIETPTMTGMEEIESNVEQWKRILQVLPEKKTLEKID